MDVEQWLAGVSAELGVGDVDLSEETVRRLLDLTREVAHNVERVGGPLTTYLVGVAVGRGAGLPASVDAALAMLERPAWGTND